MRPEQKIQRRVANQQRIIRQRFEIIAGQRTEFRLQPTLGQQDA